VNHALSGDKAANNSSILNVTLGYTENKTGARWYLGKMFSFGTANRATWGDEIKWFKSVEPGDVYQ